MLQPISSAQARNNFSDLLGDVYYGEKRFLIKKLGKSMAVLVGIDEYSKLEEAREFFFTKIINEREKNNKTPFGQVENDISMAIKAVRKKKTDK